MAARIRRSVKKVQAMQRRFPNLPFNGQLLNEVRKHEKQWLYLVIKRLWVRIVQAPGLLSALSFFLSVISILKQILEETQLNFLTRRLAVRLEIPSSFFSE